MAGPGRYGIGGRCAATQGAGEPICALWNLHATMAIYVTEVSAIHSGTGASENVRLQRTTTRGTPGSTVTPDTDSDYDRLLFPISGALLDLADYTVAPTIGASVIGKLAVAARQGAGWVLWYEGKIRVPAGTGLALVAVGAIAGSGTIDTAYRWDE